MHKVRFTAPVAYGPVKVYTERERQEDSEPLRKDNFNGYEYLIRNEVKLWQRCLHENVIKIYVLYD